MAIKQLSTANTFQHWLIATQQLITFANTLTDGGANSEFIVNTNFTVFGTLNTKNTKTETLLVTEQSTLNVLVSNTIQTNVLTANVLTTLTVTTNTARINVITFDDNTTLNSNSFISSLNTRIESVNTYVNGPILTAISSSFLHANSAYDKANASYDTANTTSTHAVAAFNHANGAFAKANSSANINAVNNITSTILYPVMVGVTGVDAVPNVSISKFSFDAANGIVNVSGNYITTGSTAGYRYADRTSGGVSSRYSTYASGNKFNIRDDLTSTDRVTVGSDGYIGIGKTSPQASLDWRDTVSVESSGPVTGVASKSYFLTSAITLNLPVTPSTGDWIKICNRGTTIPTIGRNGSLIMGTAEDMTLDIANVPFTLIYTGATHGWVIT